MPHWVPSWQLAVTVAASLGLVSLVIRFAARAKSTTKERRFAIGGLIGWQAAVLIAIYGLWQYTGSLSVVNTNHGIERGRRIWDLERAWHFPSEASFQQVFLPHHLVIRFLNLYYVIAHYNGLILMLAWLSWRHRDRYGEALTVIVLATFACLAIQLIAVAPPRLIGDHGIVDTAVQYGQSVYGPVGKGFSDQYSAMPSVHIAWSSAVAFFIYRSTTSKWRYIGIVHALLTWTVVVATGNHYWLDGLVAIGLLVIAFWTVRLGRYAAAKVSEWITWSPAPAAHLPGLTSRSGSRSGSALPSPSSSVSPDAAAAEAPAASPHPAQASPPSR